jgi:IK cytokine
MDIDDAEEAHRRAIEQSKYLGGDLEHTHLVKGLDFALLNRVKAEMDEEERKKREEEQRETFGAQSSLFTSAKQYAFIN